ncbi:MAG: nucleoside triphosphate pyrophosphohydrolase [Bdellovibrionota bacterium]
MQKLVRDLIPDLIKKTDGEASKHKIRIASNAEMPDLLKMKLEEELKEYLESNSVEELADLVEVVRAILDHNGIHWDDFEKTRLEKAKARGIFKKKFVLYL